MAGPQGIFEFRESECCSANGPGASQPAPAIGEPAGSELGTATSGCPKVVNFDACSRRPSCELGLWQASRTAPEQHTSTFPSTLRARRLPARQAGSSGNNPSSPIWQGWLSGRSAVVIESHTLARHTLLITCSPNLAALSATGPLDYSTHHRTPARHSRHRREMRGRLCGVAVAAAPAAQITLVGCATPSY